MRFVERLGAGVRLRLVAERPAADSYWDLQVLKKLARVISTFACSSANRNRWFRKLGRSISRMCAITHMAHLSEIDVSEFTHGLEHELGDASDPGRALPSFSARLILLPLRHQTSHVSWIVLHDT